MEEFGLRMTEETEDGCKGSDQKDEPKPEPIEKGRDQVREGMASGNTKKGRVYLKIKAKTTTCSSMVKVLEEDELETTDLVEKSDPDEIDLMKAKWIGRQSKPTPIWRS